MWDDRDRPPPEAAGGPDVPADTGERINLSRYTSGTPKPRRRPPPQPPPSEDEPATSGVGWVMGSPRRPPPPQPEPRNATRVIYILIVVLAATVLFGLIAAYLAGDWLFDMLTG